MAALDPDDPLAMEREMLRYLEDLQVNNPEEFEKLEKHLAEQAAFGGKMGTDDMEVDAAFEEVAAAMQSKGVLPPPSSMSAFDALFDTALARFESPRRPHLPPATLVQAAREYRHATRLVRQAE